jgi:hypothetical protein
MSLFRFFALALAVLSLATSASAQAEPHLYDAAVVVNGVEVPFRFELTTEGESASGAFFNGDERVRSTGGSLVKGSLTLQFAHYASTLQATLADGLLSGSYGRAGQVPYAFRAKPHVAAPVSAKGNTPSIAGQWEIAVKSPKGEAAWRFFVRQSGAEA